jgi:hypothetical protein
VNFEHLNLSLYHVPQRVKLIGYHVVVKSEMMRNHFVIEDGDSSSKRTFLEMTSDIVN